MIDEAVYALLAQHAGATVVPISDMVTTGLPKVIYNLLGGPRSYTDDGPDGIVPATVQLDIFAATLLQAGQIARAVRLGLDGYKGTTAGSEILRIHFPSSRRQGREQVVTGSNFAIARVTLQMVVTYREPAAAV